MIRVVSLVILLNFIVCFSFAQINDYPEEEGTVNTWIPVTVIIEGSVGWSHLIPQGTFNRHANWRQGVYGDVFVGKRDFPVRGGIGFNTIILDRKTNTITEVYNSIAEDYRHGTTSFLLSGYIGARYQPEVDFFIRPFVETRFSLHRFSTRTVIDFVGFPNDDFEEEDDFDRVARDRHIKDNTYGYGFFLGSQIMLYEREYEDEISFLLDFRIGYNGGGKVNYMVEDKSLAHELFPVDSFTERRSGIDHISIQLGVTFSY